MVAGNDFASGLLTGTWEQTADTLVLRTTYGGVPGQEFTLRYRWEGSEKVSLEGKLGSSQDMTLLRQPSSVPFPEPAESTAGGSTPINNSAESQERQEAVSCLANLKQIGIATIIYSQDYDGVMLPGPAWDQALLPYAKNPSIFSCPTLLREGKVGGYTFDTVLGGASTSTLVRPETITMFFESTTDILGATDPQGSFLATPRHDGKINVNFADGHAASR